MFSSPRRLRVVIAGLLAILIVAATLPQASSHAAELTKVRLILDWTPNTNHLGLFVAQAEGYFKEAGLDVEIIPPSDAQLEQIVASGTAAFGISYSESLAYARVSGSPVVSVAAIIQHNTSGFASVRANHPLTKPADLDGLRYGAFGSPTEEPFIKALLACGKTAKNTASVEVLNVGYVDLVTLLEQQKIDVAWLFYAWDGIRAEQANLQLDVLMLKDYATCVPDYYTPILITNETMIAEQPETVRAFVGAVAKGYAFAIKQPSEAAAILLKAAPDLGTDSKLVNASAAWLADQFQAEAPRWGEQDPEIWAKFAAFMVDNKILAEAFDTSKAFTNAFLP